MNEPAASVKLVPRVVYVILRWSQLETESSYLDLLGPPNYTGLRCERGQWAKAAQVDDILFLVEVDFCSSNPCKSNGRCLSTKSGYRCQCSEGFTGENCEGNLYSSPLRLWSLHLSTARLTISGCLSNPCSVGICYQLNQHASTYICICPDGTLNLACNSSSRFARRNISTLHVVRLV